MSSPGSFPDHFSRVAADYSAFRPSYPAALFDALRDALNNANPNSRTNSYDTTPVSNRDSHLPHPGLVWDCAAGTGQATIALGDRFQSVLATDASRKQVIEAPAHPRVQYAIALAEACPLRSESTALVTVAQALHWFDVDAFYREARRVLVKNGLLAVWSYALLRVEGNAEVEQLIDDFSSRVLGRWWPPERHHVDAGYTTLPFPFERVSLPPFSMNARWTFEQMIGYLRTWSSVSALKKASGVDPVATFEPELHAAWGNAQSLELTWPLTVLTGRNVWLP